MLTFMMMMIVDDFDDDAYDYHVDDYYDGNIIPPLQNEPHPR